MSPIVSIIMGSTSDLPVMEKAAQLLNDLHVPFEMNALSAHRTPEAVEEFKRQRPYVGGTEPLLRNHTFARTPNL